MKAITPMSFAACLFLAAISPGFAMIQIEHVTKARAGELGILVQSSNPGPDLVRVELSFPTTGRLKDFRRVDLSITENGKSVLEVPLKEQAMPGQLVVSFVAD